MKIRHILTYFYENEKNISKTKMFFSKRL